MYDYEDGVDEFEFERRRTEPQDLYDIDVIAAPVAKIIIEGTSGDDSLRGSLSDEVIRGYSGFDTMEGRGGDDTLFGKGGADVLYGNTGGDKINGGNGRDVLIDGSGNDTMTGGEQGDYFVVGDGFNIITDFEADIDKIFIPNFSLDQVTTTQTGNTVVMSYSGSSTIIRDAVKADVDAALREQEYGFVQVNPDGWGDNQQVYAWAQEVYDGYLYVSTLNLDGTQGAATIEGAAGLYRYDGTTGIWETISTDGLGNAANDGIRNLLDFNGVLYAGTLNTSEGAELLRSFDGVTFETVIDDGAGVGLGAVRALVEHDGAMYVGFQSNVEGLPLELLRTEDGENFEEITLPGMDRADYANNNSLHTLTAFDGYLYAATRNPDDGFELYRSADGINFETVIGPDGGTPSGITGSENTLVYHMIEFNGALYLGTGNFADGFGVFRSFDGTTFEQVGEYGFGDSGNTFAWRFHIFEGELYLGTNYDGAGYGGGNIWRTADGDTWEELVGVNGIYDGPGFNDTTNWGIRSFETYMGDLFVGTANYPYGVEGAQSAIGAQVFQFLGDPPADTPEYFF